MHLILIGRENVGKSTLFNRLVGQERALTDIDPGTTLDWQTLPAKLFDYLFLVSDTPGVIGETSSICTNGEGDVFAFVIDGRSDITFLDLYIASELRKKNKPICLLVNKMEKENFSYDYYQFGIDPVFLISGLHGHGMEDLYYWLKQFSSSNCLDLQSRIRISIIGRPNVGKSTLINALLGHNRMQVSDQPGTTRDSIEIPVGSNFLFIDTAGIRRKARIFESIEKRMIAHSLKTIYRSSVVLLTIDASEGIQRQDLILARHILDAGRVLIIILNKWDLVGGESVKKILNSPVLSLSALQDKCFSLLFKVINQGYVEWNQRITTRLLNVWLHEIIDKCPPPRNKNKKRIKIKYITQTHIRPPTFVMFGSTVSDLPKHYIQYLENSLRKAFSFELTPVKLLTRESHNPYSLSREK